MVLGQHVREFVRGDAEPDDERQVEEQLQRRGHPVLLVRVAPRHSSNPMLCRIRSRLRWPRLTHWSRPLTATFHPMRGAKKLVVGASGFLGSHVTRQLVDGGDDVRVLIRRTSSTKAIEDLGVEYHYGDIFDDAALRAAMVGCDDVFYCVVDTRAWLRDPAPLFRTNVEGLRHVLDAAADAALRRFVFTSSIGTIGIPAERRPATEDDEFNWADKGGAYFRSRVGAENLVMLYAKARGLPRGGDVRLEHVRPPRLATDASREAARAR